MGKQLKTKDEKILKVAREKENVLSLQSQEEKQKKNKKTHTGEFSTEIKIEGDGWC